jgi:hypothetical protein
MTAGKTLIIDTANQIIVRGRIPGSLRHWIQGHSSPDGGDPLEDPSQNYIRFHSSAHGRGDVSSIFLQVILSVYEDELKETEIEASMRFPKQNEDGSFSDIFIDVVGKVVEVDHDSKTYSFRLDAVDVEYSDFWMVANVPFV